MCRFYSSTVGKKIVMAVTGLVLVLFIIGHMAGNLKMFAGIDPLSGKYKLDLYAQYLRLIGAELMGKETFLWLVRAVLLGCIVLHALAGIQLSSLNRKAKPVKAQRVNFSASNAASRTMIFGGLFLSCFIIFHILHFTTGTVHTRGFEHGAVYSNVYKGFQIWPVTVFYLISMFFLAMHLYHGIWSMFQTLGVDSPSWNKGIRSIAKVTAAVMFFGFCSVPVAASLHLIPEPPQNTTTQTAMVHIQK